MIQPDFREFQRLAKQGNLVPVYDVFSADLLTPVSAYLRIAQGARYSFLLESVEGGEKIARYTFAGAHPEEVFRYANGACVLESRNRLVWEERDPVTFLRQRMEQVSPRAFAGPASAGRRRHRLFQLRHGAADRAPAQTIARRNRPLRRGADVLSRHPGLRSRAASLVDRAQCLHRRPRNPAREIQRGRARNKTHPRVACSNPPPRSNRAKLPQRNRGR